MICQLTQMCKEATIKTRAETHDSKAEESKDIITYEDEPKQSPIDEQSKMLCHVIVRATYELHANRHKDRTEVQLFLKNDCQQLATTELVQKVITHSLSLFHPPVSSPSARISSTDMATTSSPMSPAMW